MLKLILLTIQLLLFSSLFAQWKYYAINPSGSYRDIQVVNKNLIYIVGDYGSRTRSTDGGKTWNILNGTDKLNDFYNDVHFVNDSLGFIAGSDNNKALLLRTFSAGINWDTLNVGINSPLNTVCFLNNNIGYIGGNNGEILKTINGGISWSLLNSGVTAIINKIYFANDTLGFAVGNNKTLLRTINAGVSWTNYNFSQQIDRFTDIQMINSSLGYACTGGIYNIILFKTVDGGNSWNKVNVNVPLSNYNNFRPGHIKFINASIGYWTGDYDVLFKTIDGGANWTVVTINESNGTIPISVDFKSIDTALVVGGSGFIEQTNNGGTSWMNINQFIANDIRSIVFTSKDTGQLIDRQYGFIHRTTDGGNTWLTKLNLPYNFNGGAHVIYDMVFLNPNKGFAWTSNTNSSCILRTFNGCQTWDTVFTTPNITANKIAFINDMIGYASYGQKMLKTTDGGATWNPLSIAIQSNQGYISSFYFVNEKLGYVLTSLNLFKTKNGGLSWTNISPNTSSYNFSDVYFINDSVGLLTGDKYIYRTESGGEPVSSISGWKLIPSSNSNKLSKIKFFFNKGYIVGDNGTLLVSYNFGKSWQIETLPLPNVSHLTNIEFPTPNRGYIGGSSSTFLRYDCNSIPTATVTPMGTHNLIPSDSLLLTANNSSRYIWSNGDTTRSTLIKTPGNYNVLVIDSTGCSAISNTVEVTSTFTKINTIYTSRTQIYPNPTNGIVNVNLENTTNTVFVRLYNIIGELIYEQTNLESQLIQFNVNAPPGLYFLEIGSTENIDITKLIKQ